MKKNQQTESKRSDIKSAEPPRDRVKKSQSARDMCTPVYDTKSFFDIPSDILRTYHRVHITKSIM